MQQHVQNHEGFSLCHPFSWHIQLRITQQDKMLFCVVRVFFSHYWENRNLHLSRLFCIIFISTYQRVLIKTGSSLHYHSNQWGEKHEGFEAVRSHKLVFSLESHMELFQEQICLFLIRLSPRYYISIIFCHNAGFCAWISLPQKIYFCVEKIVSRDCFSCKMKNGLT